MRLVLRHLFPVLLPAAACLGAIASGVGGDSPMQKAARARRVQSLYAAGQLGAKNLQRRSSAPQPLAIPYVSSLLDLNNNQVELAWSAEVHGGLAAGCLCLKALEGLKQAEDNVQAGIAKNRIDLYFGNTETFLQCLKLAREKLRTTPAGQIDTAHTEAEVDIYLGKAPAPALRYNNIWGYHTAQAKIQGQCLCTEEASRGKAVHDDPLQQAFCYKDALKKILVSEGRSENDLRHFPRPQHEQPRVDPSTLLSMSSDLPAALSPSPAFAGPRSRATPWGAAAAAVQRTHGWLDLGARDWHAAFSRSLALVTQMPGQVRKAVATKLGEAGRSDGAHRHHREARSQWLGSGAERPLRVLGGPGAGGLFALR